MSMPTPEFPFYDDVTVNRPRFSERAPNAKDWMQMVSEIKAHQDVLASGDYVTAVKAIGDGVTDDTLVLKEAIATGKNVQLDPAETYVIRDTLTLQDGQVFDGRGATIKIMNQFTTTTLDVITHTVTTQLTVADVSGFQVGDYVGILQTTSLFVVQTRKIIRIDPILKIIYLQTAVNTNSGTQIPSGTTYVYRAFYAFDTGNSVTSSVIKNLTIDGNIANQQHGFWTHTGGIRLSGNYHRVEKVNMFNVLGEGIVTFATECSIRDCTFVDMAGNGVHFSQGDHVTVDTCYFKNCGKDLTIQHNHGGISWSAFCAKMVVSNCWFEDNLRGMAGISGHDESDVRLLNNFFLNNDNGSIQINATVGGSGSRQCLIAGNWSSEDAATNFSIVGNNQTTEVVQNIIVSNNHVSHTALASAFAAQVCRGVIVTNNWFECTNASHAGATARFDGVVQGTFSSNVIRGGSIGILVEGTSTVQSQCVNIVGNLVSGQKTVGIRSNKLTATFDTEINISNNNVFNEVATTSNNYNAIIINSGVLCQANVIRVDSNGGAITGTKGIVVNSNPAISAGAVVQLNQVRGNPSIGIHLFGGTGKCVVQYNIVTTSAVLTNGGGVAGTGATLTYTGIVSGGALETGTGKVSVGAGGSGYSGTITVFFLQGTNATAFGTVTLAGDAVSSVNINSGGTGYTTPGTPITVVVGGNYVTGNFTIPTTG